MDGNQHCFVVREDKQLRPHNNYKWSTHSNNLSSELFIPSVTKPIFGHKSATTTLPLLPLFSYYNYYYHFHHHHHHHHHHHYYYYYYYHSYS